MDETKESSTFSRKTINLFAGMVFGVPGLPRIFVDSGYRCHAIEPVIALPSRQVANPEIVISSPEAGNALVIEAKSGKNVNESQLQRYLQITRDVLIGADISKESCSSHELVFVGKEENTDRLLIGLGKCPDKRVILLSLGPKGINKRLNSFSVKEVENHFEGGLQIDWDVVPNSFLPLDVECEDVEFAEIAVLDLVGLILEGRTVVQVDELLSMAISQWNIIGSDYRRQLRTRMQLLLRRAAETRFNKYLRHQAETRPRWNFWQLAAPVPAEGKKTVDAEAVLKSAYKKLLEDLSSRQDRFHYSGAIQLDENATPVAAAVETENNENE